MNLLTSNDLDAMSSIPCSASPAADAAKPLKSSMALVLDGEDGAVLALGQIRNMFHTGKATLPETQEALRYLRAATAAIQELEKRIYKS